MKQFLWCFALAIGLWSAPAAAQVVGLRIPDTSAPLGSDLWLPVIADSSVTGLNVTSLQLEFSFDRTILDPDSLIQTGTMIEGLGWTVNMFRPSADVIRIAAAGTAPLSGSGPILYIRVKPVASGWTEFRFTSVEANLLNEGQPAVTLLNGWIQIMQPPSVDIWPDEGVIAVGDQLQFSTGGGSEPYTWSTSNPAIATIDASGLLTAIDRGNVQVSVEDATGMKGRTDRWVIVRAIGISVSESSVPAGLTIDVPVRVTSLTPWGVLAGSVRINYNADAVTPTEVLTSGTLLDGMAPTVNLSSVGAVRLSFAASQPVPGEGTLFIIRFQTASTPGWSNLEIVEALFNEDLPARVDNGWVSVTSAATLSVGASADRVLAEDTLAFSVWGGEAPYSWTSSDSTVATVTADGHLVGIQSGNVRVTVRDAQGAIGISNEIWVFDGAVKFGDRLATSPGWVDVPVRLARLASGRSVSSYQLKLGFNADLLAFDSFTTAGTATADWSTTYHVSGSTIAIAGATTGSLNGPGTLCTIRFTVSPSISLNTAIALSIDAVLLNEGIPSVDRWNGHVRIAEPPGRVDLWSPGDGWTQQPLNVELAWSTVSFAEQYELQVSSDTSFVSPVLWDSTLIANTVVASGLANGTRYYWRVRARNILGIGAWSEAWEFTTVAAPPPAPGLASPFDGTLDLTLTPTLIWHPSPQATSYEVQIAEDSTFVTDVRTISSIPDTVHEATPLDHARRYFWHVRAVNEAGHGPWSESWWFTTAGTPAGQPVLVAPSDQAIGVSTTPFLTWRAAANAIVYHVQVADDAAFTAIMTEGEGVSDTVWVANGLIASHTYYWRVRTYGPTDTSAYSNVWSFTTGGPDGVVTLTGHAPEQFGLEANYPNPFNPTTRLTFHVKETSPVTLTVFTLTGVEVERLVDGTLPAGTYDVAWDATRMPSGIYLCRMSAGRFAAVQRMILLK